MSPLPSLLIVEDDAIIAGNLFSFFEKRGFVVDAAYDGRTALHRLATMNFDAVVLDVGLPGVDGFTVLHRLRNALGLVTPVLMLTACDDIADSARITASSKPSPVQESRENETATRASTHR